MDKFAQLEALVAVVELESFSKAAERLGVAKSLVSRRVSALEKQIGSRLLNRTTRRLTLSESGRDFYQRARQILNDLHDAEQQASSSVAALHGVIRLAAPMSFGQKHLAPALAEFMRQNPSIEFDLDLNDREVSLVEEGFDMAVRIGQLADSSLTARRLGAIRMLTAASPDYLQKNGTPAHPSELRDHQALHYSNIPTKLAWRFQSADGQQIDAQPKLVLRANNGEALAEAASAGLGIVSTPSFILGSYCKEGRLQPILSEFERASVGLYAVYPPGRLQPRRVRLLSEFLAQRYGDNPYWDS